MINLRIKKKVSNVKKRKREREIDQSSNYQLFVLQQVRNGSTERQKGE